MITLINRKRYFALAALTIWATANFAVADEPTSNWVCLGPDGKLIYKATLNGDRIMDFSYAGYMGGGVALPSVSVKQTVKSAGEDDKDDTATIQAAIDEVAKLPLVDGFRGSVLLAPGTFNCAKTLTISTSGVVLRGSGAVGAQCSTIKLNGSPHLAFAVRPAGGGRGARGGAPIVQSAISDAYVPSGTMSLSVADATGFAVGDTIEIRKPVTEAWIKFMHMDDLVRDGKAQTWIRAGNTLTTERRIAKISDHTVTLDVPLSDSIDSKYANPPGAALAKIAPPSRISQCGVEDLHILCPEQAINHTQAHFQALRMNGEDCWARDLVIEETMNSVAVGGQRITLLRVAVNRKAPHQGSSKPAEFAPDGSQVLLDRCSVSADNVWFSATGSGHAGPIVLLNCTFHGNSHAESHQRWSTGLLYDNCQTPEGGIEIRNRGSMGSGHGWSLGWGVIWNCTAKEYIVQNPPGALNWLIGSKGGTKLAPRPFGSGPDLPEGIIESSGAAVTPQSLYLAQLAERLGPQAVNNIGY